MIDTIGVQLYTLREESAKDFGKTLEDVAKAGYDAVEFAGYYGFSALDLRKKLDSLELKSIATHTSFDEITQKTAEVIEINKTLGNKYVVCPWADMKSMENVEEIAGKLLEVQGEFEKNGLTLCYHNHDFEFKKIDGIVPMDEFIKLTKGKIRLEVDTFWVEYAGLSAAEFLREHRDIISLVHLKDGIKGNGEAKLSAIGEGELNIGEILDAVNEIGITSVIVENDNPTPNGTENIKISIANLHNKYNIRSHKV